MCDVTRMDRIMNECIRKSLCVTNIVGKIRENILRWFEHVERRNSEDIVKNYKWNKSRRKFEKG